MTIHGAGMINQVFMPVGTAAVIEAFQPRMVYGTGFQLSSACGFYHQPLLLEPSDADLEPISSRAAFQASPFAKWHGGTNDSNPNPNPNPKPKPIPNQAVGPTTRSLPRWRAVSRSGPGPRRAAWSWPRARRVVAFGSRCGAP